MMLMLTELRPLRESVQVLTSEYEEKKQVYDRTAAALDSGTAKLDQVLSVIEQISIDKITYCIRMTKYA